MTDGSSHWNDPVRLSFPKVSVQRGGFKFPTPGTPEWEQARIKREGDEILQRYVSRLVGDVMKAQNVVIDRVCWEALVTDCDVHIQRKYDTRFIGIELAPRPPGRIFPSVYEHPDDYRWVNLMDDDWDA